MSSNWTLDPKSQTCLLFPSPKLVSSNNGKLSLDETLLQNAISSCKGTYPITDTTPVAIISIIGSQSNEKYLLTKSLIQCYENGTDRNQPGKLGEFTSLSKSGVYLVNKPFSTHSNENDDVPTLVFILDLCRVEDKAAVKEHQLMEIFLLLASSMMVEVKLENEQYRLLKERDILEANKHDKRWFPPYPDLICDHLVYAFPSNAIIFHLKSNAITSSTAKPQLKTIITKSSSPANLDNLSALEKVGNINIIEIEKITKPLYKGRQCQDTNLETVMVQSLMSSVKTINRDVKLRVKVDKDGIGVKLGSLLIFMKTCVTAVNSLNEVQLFDGGLVETGAANSELSNGEPGKMARSTSSPQNRVVPQLRVPQPEPNKALTNSAQASSTGQWKNFDSNDPVTKQPTKSTLVVPPSPTTPTQPEGHGRSVWTAFDFVKRQSLSMMGYGKSSLDSPDSGLGYDEQSAQDQENFLRERDLNLKREQMRQFVSTAGIQLQSQILASTKMWLENVLTPTNIDNMLPNINAYMINLYNKQFREQGFATVDNSLWTEMGHTIELECYEICVAYLTESQNRLKQFNSEISRKLSQSKYFLPSELLKIGKQIYQMESLDLQGDRHEMVTIGCKKLLGCFIFYNGEIIKKEVALAKSLMPGLITFYNEEMARVIQADVCSPNVLDKIHLNLRDKLIQGFLTMFKFNEEGNNSIRRRLVELLDLSLLVHVQQNTEHLKNITAAISKSLDKSKSLYVKKIENVLEENPNGLEMTLLERKNEEIAKETLEELTREIRVAVRQHEPLDGHLNSIKAHMNDYWRCVLDANNQNLNRKSNPNKEKVLQRSLTFTEATPPLKEAKSNSRFISKSINNNNNETSQDDDPVALLKAKQELESLLRSIGEDRDSNKDFDKKMGAANFSKKIEKFYSVYNDPSSSLKLVQTQIKSLQIWIAELKG